MFTWGENNCGELGDGTTTKARGSPAAVNLPFEIEEDPIVSLSSGSDHSAFVTSRGFFCSWGGNTYGQLGNGTLQSVLRPEVINLEPLFNRTEETEKKSQPEKIIQVEGGDCFTVIRSNRNRFFSCGLNASGQLGIGSLMDQSSFKEVRFLSVLVTGEIKQMVTGYRHVIVLLADGNCYVWGESLLGQLGLGKRKEGVCTPTLASCDFSEGKEEERKKEKDSFPKTNNIVQVGASGCASFFLLDTGEVYSCGIHDLVGQGSAKLWKGEEGNFFTPTKMDGISSRADTLFGESASRSIFAVNLSEKIVFAWGSNSERESGIENFVSGIEEDYFLPRRAFSSLLNSGKRLLSITAGSNFSAILLKGKGKGIEKEDYSLYTSGRGRGKWMEGEREGEDDPKRVPLNPPLFTQNEEEREWTLRSGAHFLILALVRRNSPLNPSLKTLVYRFYKFHYET